MENTFSTELEEVAVEVLFDNTGDETLPGLGSCCCCCTAASGVLGE